MKTSCQEKWKRNAFSSSIKCCILVPPKNFPSILTYIISGWQLPIIRPVATGGVRGQCPPNILFPPNCVVPRKICCKHTIKTKILTSKIIFFPKKIKTCPLAYGVARRVAVFSLHWSSVSEAKRWQHFPTNFEQTP